MSRLVLIFYKKLSYFPNFLCAYKGGRSDILNKQHSKIFDRDNHTLLENDHLDKKIAETNIKSAYFLCKSLDHC